MALFERTKEYEAVVAKGFSKGTIITKGYAVITEVKLSKPRPDGSVQAEAQIKVFMSKDDTIVGMDRDYSNAIHSFFCGLNLPKEEADGDVFAALYPRVERLIVCASFGDSLDEKTRAEVDKAFSVRSDE